jgi:flagellar hook-length control protein FliK
MTQTDYAVQNLIQAVNQMQQAVSANKSEKSTDFQTLLKKKSQDSAGTDAPVQEAADGSAVQTVTVRKDADEPEETTLPQELACAQLLAQAILPTVVQQTQVSEEQTAAAVETLPTVVSAQEIALRQVPGESVPKQTQQTVDEGTQLQVPETEAISAQQQTQPVQASQPSSADQGQTSRREEDLFSSDTAKDELRVEVTDVPTQAEQPVFRDVETTMIKVGEAPAAESTEETVPVDKQVADQLTQALEQGESKVEVQLTPASLGNVTVEVTQQKNGTLSVVLTAENDHTRTLLQQHMGNLQELLGSQSQKDVQVEVARQQESQQQNNATYDGRNGSQGGQQQEQRQQNHQQQEQDFLQQLRLGLIPLDGEAS